MKNVQEDYSSLGDSNAKPDNEQTTTRQGEKINGFTVGFQAASSLSTGRKFVLGVIIVIVIAFTWVGSTQTAKSTYSGGFKAPFFLVWFGTAWMMVVFPLTVPLYFIVGPGKLSIDGFKQLWR